MRRFGSWASAVVIAAAAAGCGSGGGGTAVGSNSTAPGATSAPTPTSAGATVPLTNFTLRVTKVQLLNSEQTDNAMRVLLPAGVTTASVTLSGLPTPNKVVTVCQAQQVDARMPAAACRTPANGEAVTVAVGPATPAVEIDQSGVSGDGPGANSTAVDEVTIRYAASSRQLVVRLPQVAAADVGPTLSLTPGASDGNYQATLGWSVIGVFGGAPSSGQLELLQGGAVINQAQGGADVRLNGNVPPPAGDVAIRVRNPGAAALVSPKLTVVLP